MLPPNSQITTGLVAQGTVATRRSSDPASPRCSATTCVSDTRSARRPQSSPPVLITRARSPGPALSRARAPPPPGRRAPTPTRTGTRMEFAGLEERCTGSSAATLDSGPYPCTAAYATTTTTTTTPVRCAPSPRVAPDPPVPDSTVRTVRPAVVHARAAGPRLGPRFELNLDERTPERDWDAGGAYSPARLPQT